MAEIKTVVSGDLTVHRVVGVLTAEEAMDAVRRYYAGEITKNVVWHLPMGSTRELMSGDVKGIVQLVLALARDRPGGRTAFVAPADLEFGVSRMLCTFGEIVKIPLAMAAFRTLAEAAEWIGVDQLAAIEDTIEGDV